MPANVSNLAEGRLPTEGPTPTDGRPPNNNSSRGSSSSSSGPGQAEARSSAEGSSPSANDEGPSGQRQGRGGPEENTGGSNEGRDGTHENTGGPSAPQGEGNLAPNANLRRGRRRRGRRGEEEEEEEGRAEEEGEEQRLRYTYRPPRQPTHPDLENPPYQEEGVNVYRGSQDSTREPPFFNPEMIWLSGVHWPRQPGVFNQAPKKEAPRRTTNSQQDANDGNQDSYFRRQQHSRVPQVPPPPPQRQQQQQQQPRYDGAKTNGPKAKWVSLGAQRPSQGFNQRPERLTPKASQGRRRPGQGRGFLDSAIYPPFPLLPSPEKVRKSS